MKPSIMVNGQPPVPIVMRTDRGIPWQVTCTEFSCQRLQWKTATGKTTVEGMTIAADVGVINNKLTVDGQIYGGVAQGIGLALTEDYEDIKKHATLAGAGFPYIKQIPDNLEIMYIETPRERGPFGSAGVGEMPLTSPHASIINAIYNACGARVRHLPARPEKVLAAMPK